MTDSKWTADSIPDLTGRTIVVTGANSGLGLATTRELARHGAHVVLAVRDETKGRRAVAEISTAQPGARLELRRLDLADLDSVTAFAAGMQDSALQVDVLINNAGVMGPPHTRNRDGQELQFATNHLGHFALTGLLLDQLQTRHDPRVVTVTSDLHRGARIEFDYLTGVRTYAPMRFYRQSKFANVVFALELDRRLRAARTPVRSLLAHPGFSATNLQTTGPTGLLRTFVTLAAGSRPGRGDGRLAPAVRSHRADRRGRTVLRLRRPAGAARISTTVRPDPAAADRTSHSGCGNSRRT